MSVIIKLARKNWEITEKADNKRLATQREPEGIKQHCNIPYIDDGNSYHLLDVYYPENTTGKLPVIIDIHGGGWMYGTKELNKIYNLNLAKRGYTVFNMSYPLVPDVFIETQIRDCMSAIDFISENLDDYPCDKDKIILTGDSAGGMLAAFCMALINSEKLRKIFDTVAPEINISSLILTAPAPYTNGGMPTSIYTVPMWGKDIKKKPFFDYMNLNDLLPHTKFPPTCLITSSGDYLARKQTLQAEKDLSKAGVETLLIDVPKYEGKHLPHVFCVMQPEEKASVEVIDKSLEFCRSFWNE